MKNKLSLLLAFVLCFTLLPMPALAAETGLMVRQIHYNDLDMVDFVCDTIYDDDGDRLRELWYDSGGVLSGRYEWLYDDAGNLRSYVQYDGSELVRWRYEYTYNDAGNILSEVFYDGDGTVDSRTEYTYDDIGNLQYKSYNNVSDNYIWDYEYTYDAAGNTLSEIGKTGGLLGFVFLHYEYTYDDAGNRLSAIKYDDTGAVEWRYEYTYDDAGNMLSRVEHNSGGAVDSRYEYTYDNAGNKLSEIKYDGGGAVEWCHEYTYDDAGNMLSEIAYGDFGWVMYRNEYFYTILDEPEPSDGHHAFTDVPANAYYADAVQWAVENNVTTGTGGTTFSPEGNVTRAQAVTFLWRAQGSPEPNTPESQFTDVQDAGLWYYKAVLWAVENGITTGTSTTTFSPEEAVSRGQMMAFLYRTMGEPWKTGIGAWYEDAENWARQNGLLDGTAVSYSTDGDCPRSDVVYYLWKALAG